MADADITLATVIGHMQGMEQRLRLEFRESINTCERGIRVDMNERFDRLERKVDLLSVQAGNIDTRLDDIEIVQLPALRKAVGIR